MLNEHFIACMITYEFTLEKRLMGNVHTLGVIMDQIL